MFSAATYQHHQHVPITLPRSAPGAPLLTQAPLRPATCEIKAGSPGLPPKKKDDHQGGVLFSARRPTTIRCARDVQKVSWRLVLFFSFPACCPKALRHGTRRTHQAKMSTTCQTKVQNPATAKVPFQEPAMYHHSQGVNQAQQQSPSAPCPLLSRSSHLLLPLPPPCSIHVWNGTGHASICSDNLPLAKSLHLGLLIFIRRTVCAGFFLTRLVWASLSQA
ncbi:uncharacterized protein J3D65DRAFT_423228 [Phyllosticta citribraziliensis]|uniref:Uncharacterized protein n=1 Tax=Phyllosticta citribraziliensis TaxID=989973 RepID=A0ABR1LJR1_9PEZI